MDGDIRKVICRKWAIEILLILDEDGAQNFSNIEAQIETSSDVVSKRLQELVGADALSRDVRSPKDIRYHLTPTGKELLALVEKIHHLLEK